MKLTKLIITIPEDKYKYIQGLEQGNTDYATTRMLYHAVKNGTLIPDNATRYDIAKLFYGTDDAIDLFNELQMGKDWWNSPYQKGGK
jgi:hypothetical protein